MARRARQDRDDTTRRRRSGETGVPALYVLDRDAARQILTRLARRAYRRPAAEADLNRLLGFYDRVRAKGGSFEDGIRATVKTLSLSYYVNVRRCFADKAAYPEAIRPKDFTSWVGSDVYGKRIVDYMAERFSRPATAAPESSVREIAREEAEKMVGVLFLPLLMQVLDLAPETFTDDKALAAIRAKLLAPAARVPSTCAPVVNARAFHGKNFIDRYLRVRNSECRKIGMANVERAVDRHR